MNVFGKVRLGYLIARTERFADWHRFASDAIGMHVDQVDRSATRLRLDDHTCRFLLLRGPEEDVSAFGWQVDDQATFEEVLRRVSDAGVPVSTGTDDEAALRGVARLARFPGPKGIAQEIFTGSATRCAPPPWRSKFVTGEYGLGHVALTSKQPASIRGYYETVFDARLSDHIDETISGVKLKVRFLRLNARHHTVAVAGTGPRLDPVRTRIQHVNVQVGQLDDMVGSYQRVTELGFRMAWGIGQHTNDRELSYYCVTPSGFELEVGWNPIVVDEDTWTPTTHRGISIWGHTPVGETVIGKLHQFGRALASGMRHEASVPRLQPLLPPP